jgi:hypothetical protein
MKKLTIIFSSLLISIFLSQAQSPIEIMKERQEKFQAEQREYNEGLVDTTKRFFYKTYEDYAAGKPEQGIKYVGKRKIVLGGESVLVNDNGEFVDKKVKDLPYWGLIDESGQLERIYEDHCYYVFAQGKICSYLKAIDVEMTTDKNGNINLNWLIDNMAGYKDYISEGLDGKIEVFSEKKFQSLTADKPEVFEQFQQEPLDVRIKDKRSQKSFKLRKYVEMYSKDK